MSSTNFTRNGLSDWLVQRLSALVLLAFVICVAGFYAYHQANQQRIDYNLWYDYFSSMPMKIFTALALCALLGHLWVGMWTVITDYIKPLALRLICQGGLFMGILALLFWVGFIILGL